MPQKWSATAIVALLCFTALGCKPSEATIDTSTEANYQTSLAAVKAALPSEQHEKFGKALMQIAIGDVVDPNGSLLANINAMTQATKDPMSMLGKLAPHINGKTGAQVIAAAETLADERRARQLAAVEAEIAALETSQGNSDSNVQARTILDQIKVEGSRYYWAEGSYRKEPTIEFKITNGSTSPIAKIFVRGIVETPGRAVPWVKESFNYDFKGGLEPKESQLLNLAPNSFGAWGNKALQDRNDLVLTLTLVGIEDAAGTEITDTTLGDDDKRRERLRILRQQRMQLTTQPTNADGTQ